MKLAILGTGSVGQAFATRFSGLGHQVMIGTRSVADKTADPKFSEYLSKNPLVALGTFGQAAAFGELLVNASKGATTLQMLKDAGSDNLKGKILVDVSNPLDFSQGMPPGLIPELSNFNSLGEEIQKQFPGTLVVKTLNTMWNGIMLNPTMIGQGDHINYICGNDDGAKKKTIDLLHQLGWKDEHLLDLGDIRSARATEATLPIWLRVCGAKKSSAFNFKIVM